MLPKPITADDFELMQDPDFSPTGNGRGRRKSTRTEVYEPKAPREPKAAKAPATIQLAPDRISKLWNILSGGRLVIENDPDHGIICHVSRDSFDSLLEGMIDRL